MPPKVTKQVHNVRCHDAPNTSSKHAKDGWFFSKNGYENFHFVLVDFFDLSIPFFWYKRFFWGSKGDSPVFFKGPSATRGSFIRKKKHPGWFGLVCLLGGLNESPCDLNESPWHLRPPPDVIEAAEFLQQHAHELENRTLTDRELFFFGW